MQRIQSNMKEVRLDLITPWGTFELHEQEYNMTITIINDMTHGSRTIFNHKVTQPLKMQTAAGSNEHLNHYNAIGHQ